MGQPEAWLRGPVPGIPDPLQPVAHALIAAREDVRPAVESLAPGQLWLPPGGAASVGYHLLHLAGSTDRLFTYARGGPLSAAQKATLAAERTLPEPRPPAYDLLSRWEEVVDRALAQLSETDERTVHAPRLVGRAQLPSSVLGLLAHAADHATRHVGQIITTAKILHGLSVGV